MFCIMNHLIKQEVQAPDTSSCLSSSIPVSKIYLSHLSDNKGILITSIKRGYTTENKIPLKFEHSDHFDLLQLSYKGPEFHDYFPLDATFKVKEILLKKSRSKKKDSIRENRHKNVSRSGWNVMHIKTENESDCNYLFEKAVENNYTIILAIQFEITNTINASRKLTLYPHCSNDTPLHLAVAEKDIKTIEVLLRCNLDINSKNLLGLTPLHVAVNSEMSDVVDFLINNGADVNAQQNLKKTALHYAVTRNNFKILDSLFKRQAKLNKKDAFGQTPLHNAVSAHNADVVDILLKNGANYKREDNFGRTPFDLAAQQKSLDIIEVFLNNNIDANILNSHKQPPIFNLSKRSRYYQFETFPKETYLQIINALLKKGANINFKNVEGYTPLHHAVIDENVEFMHALLECNADVNIQDNLNRNLLHLACFYKATKCIQTLLNLNIDIDAVDAEQRTALHIAVKTRNYSIVELILKKNPNLNMRNKYRKTALCLAIESVCVPIVEILLRNGADPNLKYEFGKTSLHLALELHHSTIIELLLDYKADVSFKDKLGRTALHLASAKFDMETKIIKSMLSLTTDIDAQDYLGRTALHYAILHYSSHTRMRDSNINIDYILNYKEKIFLDLPVAWDNKSVLNSKCIKLIVDHKANVNVVDNNLISPLHLACFTKNVEAIKYLIQNGADSNMRDNLGRTVFHYTCMDELNEMSLCIKNIEGHIKDILNVLVEENISVNCVDKFDKTPLHYVSENKWLFLVSELLLNIGADINILDMNDNSPLDNYSQHKRLIGYDQILKVFKKHIIKMQVLKLWVQTKILDQVFQLENKKELRWFQSYERDCDNEIDLLKSTHVEQCNITYFDLLKKSLHDTVNYTRNQYVMMIMRSNELITTFPIYSHFIICHLREALQRKYLYEKIQESLESFIFEKLPTNCMDEILRYLDNSELNRLLVAMKPVVMIA